MAERLYTHPLRTGRRLDVGKIWNLYKHGWTPWDIAWEEEIKDPVVVEEFIRGVEAGRILPTEVGKIVTEEDARLAAEKGVVVEHIMCGADNPLPQIWVVCFLASRDRGITCGALADATGLAEEYVEGIFDDLDNGNYKWG